ncbi:MAG: hypothetical protein DCF30_07630 [Hyphomicrobiales bacterium]|nr:MAG: hypothetical protein DCF30_07630 [Hyphomicrobiales bacterium]
MAELVEHIFGIAAQLRSWLARVASIPNDSGIRSRCSAESIARISDMSPLTWDAPCTARMLLHPLLA